MPSSVSSSSSALGRSDDVNHQRDGGSLRLLDNLESCADSPRDVAFLRIESLLHAQEDDDDDDNDNNNDDDDVSHDNDTNNGDHCCVSPQVGVTAAPAGLAPTLVGALQAAVQAVHQRLVRVNEEGLPSRRLQSTTAPSPPTLSKSKSIQSLQRILTLLKRLTVVDITLSEEVVVAGSHSALQTILRWDAMALQEEVDQDVLVELQDMAGELAAQSLLTFPHVASTPFSESELRQRLPVVFKIQLVPHPAGQFAATTTKAAANGHNDPPQGCETLPEPASSTTLSVLIHQVTDRQAAQQDVGFVLWPSSVVLARYLVQHPYLLQTASQIWELGAGCGLVGLTAALFIAQQQQSQQTQQQQPQQQQQQQQQQQSQPYLPVVCLTDCNATVLQNLKRNVCLNGVNDVCRVESLDFHNPEQIEFAEQKPPDLVLAADVICQPSDAVAMAHWLSQALRPGDSGGKAVVVSAAPQHRFGVDALVPACHNCGLEVSVYPVDELDGGRLLRECAADLAQTSGYVESMQLNLYLIRNP